jgi:hypothetical protein
MDFMKDIIEDMNLNINEAELAEVAEEHGIKDKDQKDADKKDESEKKE